MTETCKECRFYRADGSAYGECRAHPQYVRRLPGDWCGEWVMSDAARAVAHPKTDAEPVREPLKVVKVSAGQNKDSPLERPKQQPEGELPDISEVLRLADSIPDKDLDEPGEPQPEGAHPMFTPKPST